jgi:D-3-phosphoglycerate dehydrogenase
LKVVICDSKEAFSYEDISYSINYLKENLASETEIVYHEYDGNKDKLISILKDADALLTGYLDIDESIMKDLENLKIISVMATGYNSINVDHANKNRIGVAICAEYCTQEVAEQAICLLLSLNKKLKHYMNEVDNNYIWNYLSTSGIIRLEGTTLGILGLGKIGRAIGKRAQGFGIKVVGYDPYIDKELVKECGIELLSVDEILEISDNISVNMLLNEENKNFLDMDKFKKMKKKPYIINVARGPLINESDLIDALDKKLIKGAGLDVLDTEVPDLKNNPLVGRENVIITPHSAFYSDTSMMEVQRIACNNVIYYLNNELEKMFRLVNTPKDFK